MRLVEVYFQPKAQWCLNRKPNGIGLRQGLPAETQRNICASSLILKNELLGRGDFSGFGCALVLQHRRFDCCVKQARPRQNRHLLDHALFDQNLRSDDPSNAILNRPSRHFWLNLRRAGDSDIRSVGGRLGWWRWWRWCRWSRWSRWSRRWWWWRGNHCRRWRWCCHGLNHRCSQGGRGRYVRWRNKRRRWRFDLGHLLWFDWLGWWWRRGRRRWNDDFLDHDRFERLFQSHQRVLGRARDDGPANQNVQCDHNRDAFVASRGVLRFVDRMQTRACIHWTNCSLPITAILVSPFRLDVDRTLAKTAYCEALLGRICTSGCDANWPMVAILASSSSADTA